MIIKTLFLLVILLVNFSCLANENMDSECSLESTGNREYFELLCKAEYLKSQKKYDKAIIYLEKALKLPIHEAFNFETYAMLADAYRLNGNSEKYELNKRKFKLSLAVYTGIYSCSISNGSFNLVNRHGHKVHNIHASEVSRAMCAAETEFYLERDSIDRLDNEAQYYKLYIQLMGSNKREYEKPTRDSKGISYK